MNDNTQEQQELPFWKKIRLNVLLLMLMAYGSLLVIFFGLVGYGVAAETAYHLISTPFVALIGGTLAVAKDLI